MKTNVLKHTLNALVILLLILILITCANPVSPTGGPQDSTPPEAIKAEPPQLTLNFNRTKIRIYFNEFVSLKNVQSQLIISPPMNENPEIKIKGKSIIIEFQEPLKDSTTYNLFFGDAIVDITEGNPISNFQYVFSTGNVLDSLTFKGSVKDAFTLEPVAGTNVMLYMNINDTIPFDSLPYFIKPYYMTKTNDQGDFVFHNLSNKRFKLFVLEDGNSNMIYDQVTERIAFTDSLIKPYYIPPRPVPDTTMTSDSLVIDTVAYTFREPELLNMRLFQEYDSVQRFLKATLLKKNELAFIYKRPTLNYRIEPLNSLIPADWKLESINPTKDTVIYWIYQLEQDSMTFEISDNGLVLDTVDVALVKRSSRRQEKKEEDEKLTELNVSFSKVAPAPTAESELLISFSYPILKIDTTGLLFKEDTNYVKFPEIIFTDSIKTTAVIKYNWQQLTSYKFVIPDSVFVDILGQSHDSLQHGFRTKSIEDFGNLFLDINITQPGINYIVQLLKEDAIKAERRISESQRLSFTFLNPDDYIVKVIYDSNNNGKWDAGNYIYNIQPEEVRFFEKVITVRANWDIEENWEL